MKKREPCFEAGIFYARQGYIDEKTRKEFGLTKIYLYRWNSPSGHIGIDHVYVHSYTEFLGLLLHWNRGKWGYYAL